MAQWVWALAHGDALSRTPQKTLLCIRTSVFERPRATAYADPLFLTGQPHKLTDCEAFPVGTNQECTAHAPALPLAVQGCSVVNDALVVCRCGLGFTVPAGNHGSDMGLNFWI